MTKSIQSVGASLYTKLELFCDVFEGRSLYNDATKLYRHMIGLQTPIMKDSQLSVSDIITAIGVKFLLLTC